MNSTIAAAQVSQFSASFPPTENFSDSSTLPNDSVATPRDYSHDMKIFNQVVSPMPKKRGRHNGPGQFGNQSTLLTNLHDSVNIPRDIPILQPIEKINDADEPSYIFGLSQDDAIHFDATQSSQEFTDRFGQQCHVNTIFKGHEETTNTQEGPTNSNLSRFCYDPEHSSMDDGLQAPFLSQVVGQHQLVRAPERPTQSLPQFPMHPDQRSRPPIAVQLARDSFKSNKENNSKSRNAASTSTNCSTAQDTQQIKIPPPLFNPFFDNKLSHTSSSHMWLSAAKEQPRYVIDFHQEGELGYGASSTVYVARKRLDGVLYAVKRLKATIHSETERKALTKEVHAHSVLQGCPHIVQYFNSWIDDGHLYIQTELCPYGTLDAMVKQTKIRVNLSAMQFAALHSRVDSFDLALMQQSNNPDSQPLVSNILFTQNSTQSGGGNNRGSSHMGIQAAAKASIGRMLVGRQNRALSDEYAMGISLHNDSEADAESIKDNINPMDQSTMSVSGVHQHGEPLFSQNTSQHSHQFTSSENVEYQESSSNQPTINEENNVTTKQENATTTEKSVWNILDKIGSALDFMHKRGLAHMDVRPANMFLAATGSFLDLQTPRAAKSVPSHNAFMSQTDSHSIATTRSNIINNPIFDPSRVAGLITSGECAVKLGDFGLACRLDTTGEIEEGESRYCAREVINADGAIDLRKADIFSLGASVYEIMLGRQLGAGGDHGSEEWHNIRDGILDEEFLRAAPFTSALSALVVSMVHPIPSQRPTAEQVAQAAGRVISTL